MFDILHIMAIYETNSNARPNTTNQVWIFVYLVYPKYYLLLANMEGTNIFFMIHTKENFSRRWDCVINIRYSC